MTNGFTLPGFMRQEDTVRIEYTIRYSANFLPEFFPPKSQGEFDTVVSLLPQIALPYEILNIIRGGDGEGGLHA